MGLHLAGWQGFYVIVGSSAGALIGLQFVVIALISTTRTRPVATGARAFATPTIVHFSTVLLTAATLSVMRHTRTSLVVVLVLIGALGLAYMVRVGMHMKRQGSYVPDLEDRIWHVALPVAAYAGLFAAGVSAPGAPEPSLVVAACGVMTLLIVGIHNAWDAALYMVLSSQENE